MMTNRFPQRKITDYDLVNLKNFTMFCYSSAWPSITPMITFVYVVETSVVRSKGFLKYLVRDVYRSYFLNANRGIFWFTSRFGRWKNRVEILNANQSSDKVKYPYG